MNGMGVFLTMVGLGAVYAMASGNSSNVRLATIGSRRYRVTHLGPNRWRIERIDESMKTIASAEYEYGKDLSVTNGNVEALKELASDMLLFPADLFA